MINAFWDAVKTNNVEEVRAIIARDGFIPDGINYLEHAVVFKSNAVLEFLLENKFYEQRKWVNNLPEAWTSAAGNGNVDAIKLLIKFAPAPNVKNQGDYTPLMLAYAWHHDEIVRLLLGAGADPSPRHPLFEKTAPEFTSDEFGGRWMKIAPKFASDDDGARTYEAAEKQKVEENTEGAVSAVCHSSFFRAAVGGDATAAIIATAHSINPATNLKL